MFSILKNRLGIPGLIAVIALVFAMGGAAWAAKKYVITSTGQIKPSVLKQLKGAKGPQGKTGSQGPAGANGTNGKDGVNGKAGTNGTAGKSVVTGAIAPGLECEEGGAYVEVEGSGDKEPVCDGIEGSPWTAGGALPSGETLTGTYGGFFVENDQGMMPISFSLPVEPAPTATYVSGAPTADCPGVVDGVPTAEPGNLCLYKGLATAGTPLGFLKPLDPGTEEGPAPSGTVFAVLCASPSCTWHGTWAVTAE